MHEGNDGEQGLCYKLFSTEEEVSPSPPSFSDEQLEQLVNALQADAINFRPSSSFHLKRNGSRPLLAFISIIGILLALLTVTVILALDQIGFWFLWLVAVAIVVLLVLLLVLFLPHYYRRAGGALMVSDIVVEGRVLTLLFRPVFWCCGRKKEAIECDVLDVVSPPTAENGSIVVWIISETANIQQYRLSCSSKTRDANTNILRHWFLYFAWQLRSENNDSDNLIPNHINPEETEETEETKEIDERTTARLLPP